ncbi:protein kinase domain-containing protein [Frankia sp. CcWB3]
MQTGVDVPGDAHGVRMQPPRATDPGSLGRHRVLGRLGAGGMGVVYLAEGPLGQVAVKLIRPEYADDPQFRARFHREVQACFRVGGAHTARLVDFELEAERPWLATEFVDAPDLAAQVAAAGPLPTGEQIILAAGLAEALASIHAAGLIHRDLKPSNVLWTADGPKVIDFGIAAAAEARPLTAVGGVVGTPGWLSPEQATGGEVTAASDVFGWGGTGLLRRHRPAAVRQRLRRRGGVADRGRRVPDRLRPARSRAACARPRGTRPPAAATAYRARPVRAARRSRPGAQIPVTRILPDAARTPTPPAAPQIPGSPQTPAPEPRARRRRRWLLVGAGTVVVLALAGALATVLVAGGNNSSADNSTSSRQSFTADAPWRLAIIDQIEGTDNGCTIIVTSDSTGEQQTIKEVYGAKTFQVPLVGGFHWQANDPGCSVTARSGSGTAVLPFAQQAGTGDTDAFEVPSGLVRVEVVDFAGSDDCGLQLHDAADGREISFGTAARGGPPLLLDPSGRTQVYLANLTCGVRVSAAPG